MKHAKYITSEYVPSVDLNTLGNTYNTLAQGHKEAVQAASALESSIAKLEMNEAEDGFKQQLLNEIAAMVDENTVYGNSYGALDDIIAKVGKIDSDQRVIGRLRSQQAKKEYDAKVDNMKISEGMKQMYKDINPYYYEDGPIDKTTGKATAGTVWKATKNPVDTVGQNVIQSYALQIAAKEAGSYDSVSFLDAAGNPTTDPKRSADGQMYQKVGTKYERLSSDKIKSAYQVAINSIPGAKESLMQDYEYAGYEYKKMIEANAKNGGDVAPVVPGYTDNEGHVYTYNQWIDNNVNGFANVAAYEHVFSDTQFGTALQARHARVEAAKQAAAKQASFAGANGGTPVAGGFLVGPQGRDSNVFGTNTIGTRSVQTNAFQSALNTKAKANYVGLSMLRNIDPTIVKGANSLSDIITKYKQKNNASGPNIATNEIIKKYGDKLTAGDKAVLRNAFNAYVSNNQLQNKYRKAAGADADAITFSAELANGKITNSNSYGAKLTKQLNDIYKGKDAVTYDVGSDIMDNLVHSYGGSIAAMRNQGFVITQKENGNYDVSIGANIRTKLPEFENNIQLADSKVEGSLWGWTKKAFTGKASSGNYVSPFDGTVGFGNMIKTMHPIKTASDMPVNKGKLLAKEYNKAIKKTAAIEEKVGLTKGTVSVSAMTASSYDEMYYTEYGHLEGLKDTDIERNVKNANEKLNKVFSNPGIDFGQIETIDGAGRIVKVDNNQEAKVLLQKAYIDNKVTRQVILPSHGYNNVGEGYIHTITVPEDTGKYKKGQIITFITSGTVAESKNYTPSNNPEVIANNQILAAKATHGVADNLGYNVDFGDTRMFYQPNGKFKTSGAFIKGELDEDSANRLAAIYQSLSSLKNRFHNGEFSDDVNKYQMFINSANVVAAELSEINGADINTNAIVVGNYLNSPINE